MTTSVVLVSLVTLTTTSSRSSLGRNRLRLPADIVVTSVVVGLEDY